MPTLSYKNDNEQDERLNPATGLRNRENGDIPGYDRSKDGHDDHPISAGVADGEEPSISKNTDDLRKKEALSLYNPNKAANKPVTGKINYFRKKGPLFGLIGGLVGGGGLIGVMLTPALLPVSIMEAFTNDLNDSTSWNEKKVRVMMGKKLGSMQKKLGYCGKVVTIRCKFATMSQSQADKFNRSDSRVKLEGQRTKGIAGGRIAYTHMTFTDDFGKKSVVRTPAQLNRLLRTDVAARSSLYHVWNAKNSSFFGKRFSGIVGKFGSSLAKKIKGESKSETDESYKAASTDSSSGDGVTAESKKDGDEKTEDGKNKNELAGKLGDEFNKNVSAGTKVKASAVKLSGVLALPQLGCGAYQVGSIVDASAKTVKAARLAKFAMIFLTAAAAIKAGEATSAEVEKATDILVPSKYPEQVEDPLTGDMIDNPNMGKNALDSEAYKMVAHGDEGNLNSIASQFLVAGGTVGTLATIINTMNKVKGGRGTIRTACKIVNNKVVNFVATIAGGAAAIGLAAAAKVFEKQIGEIFASIINLAIDASAGSDLTTDLQGVDAGNAMFAGTAVILGGSAMSLGMKPGNKASILKNVAANHQVNQDYIAVERYDARDTPFDASNKYSFLGSLVSSLHDDTSSSKSSLGSLLSVLPKSVRSVGSSASAEYSMPAGYSNTTDRFSKCTDDSYKELGIDADTFCNVRYVPFADRDVDSVLDYMEGKNKDKIKYIDDETGEPKDAENAYAKYLEFCVNRTDGWGEASGALDTWATGEACMKDTERNINFANYIAYFGAQDDMDTEAIEGDLTSSGAGGKLRVATFNMRGASHTGGQFKGRMDKSVAAIKRHEFNVIGHQELQKGQRTYMMSKLGSGWGIFPSRSSKNDHHSVENSITWNSQMFKLVGSGYIPNVKYFGGSKLNAPWVLLEDIDNSDGAVGQKFYVGNTHDPAFPENAAHRKNNAVQHARFMHEKRATTQLPVIMTGDFNASFSLKKGGGNPTFQGKKENITYCIMTESGVIENALDTSVKRPRKCPNPPKGYGNPIDHIFFTKELDATNFTKIEKGYGNNGSDHPTYFADITIPGIGGDPATGTTGKDIGGDDYKKECSKYFINGVNCGGQCVDFVKFRLLKHKVSKFLGGILGNSLGNGKDVVGNLRKAGYRVSKTPAVHSVMSTAATSQPQYGHTAMVSQVNADGSIVVEEYNYAVSLGYSKRHISKKEIRDKNMTFAHTEVDYK